MKKIKVAIFLNNSERNWAGGYNYIVNLLKAYSTLKNSKIIFFLIGPDFVIDNFRKKFKNVEYISSSKLNLLGISLLISKFLAKYFDFYYPLDKVLNYLGISVLAYGPPLGHKSKVTSVCWIPDFQHQHIPNFFSRSEFKKRNKYNKKIVKDSTLILLSSYSAQSDLFQFHSSALLKSRVLRFVASHSIKNLDSLSHLKEKYGISNTYMYVPNQFWVHKNHKILVDALCELLSRNIKVNVVSTGEKFDYRHKNYFEEFVDYLNKSKAKNQFKILGYIPHNDVLSLMKHSFAIINPSYFEGWSSTVEESKLLNKRIILSDIPVHKEQNPVNGIFFNPYSSMELADCIEKVLNLENQKDEDVLISEVNSSENSKKIIKFAMDFEDIVVDSLKNQN